MTILYNLPEHILSCAFRTQRSIRSCSTSLKFLYATNWIIDFPRQLSALVPMSLIYMNAELVRIIKLLLTNLTYWVVKMFISFSFFHA